MDAIRIGYAVVLALLAGFSWHRLSLALRGRRIPKEVGDLPAELPRVLIQLPVYNEPFVVRRGGI